MLKPSLCLALLVVGLLAGFAFAEDEDEVGILAPPPDWDPGGNPQLDAAFDRLAQVHAAPGLPTGSIFEGFEDLEAVSLLGGDLTFAHPLGREYPIDGGWSVGLKLVYNSKNAQKWRVRHDAPEDAPPVYEERTNGHTWAGFGWTLHLGRIFRRPGYDTEFLHAKNWTQARRDGLFEEPDGTQRRFSPRVDDAGPLRIRFFRRSSDPSCPSYAPRMECPVYCTSAPADPLCGVCGAACDVSADGTEHYTVTYPDGRALRLEKIVEEVELTDTRGWIRNFGQSGWYTTQITDVFGNSVHVEYQRTGEHPEAIRKIWITDPAQPEISTDLDANGHLLRVHVRHIGGTVLTYGITMEMKPLIGTSMVPVITRIDLPAIGGTPAGRILYGYAPARTVEWAGDMNPDSGPVVDTITYPTDGVSRYTY